MKVSKASHVPFATRINRIGISHKDVNTYLCEKGGDIDLFKLS